MNDAEFAHVLVKAKGDVPPPGMALKPGSATNVVGADPAATHVVVDGDTVATPVQSLIGALVAGARVMILFWPPHGAYVVGAFSGRQPNGLGPWFDVTFNTGWANYGGTAQDVQYRIEGNTVKLRGIATRSSGVNTIMFTLPAGYAPQADENFAVDSDPQEHSNVSVRSNGDVEWFPSTLATAAYVSVSGINFDPYDYV